MSDYTFDPHAEPHQYRHPAETPGWRAFDPAGQVAAPPPPQRRPRNPYDPGPDVDPRLSTRYAQAPPSPPPAPPSQRSAPPPAPPLPQQWPPVATSSPPRVGAGLRTFHEPSTEETPALQQPGSRFREPITSENMTVGRRPPSPYREYVTGENPTVSPPRSPAAPRPEQVRPSPQPHFQGPDPDLSAASATTAPIERQSRPYADPSTGQTAMIDRHPPAAPSQGWHQPSPPRHMDTRAIHVEPDTGSMSGVQADPPWQSRRAAEEDASFISPMRVLGTVGVIVIVIALAGAVIWGLNLYGDRF